VCVCVHLLVKIININARYIRTNKNKKNHITCASKNIPRVVPITQTNIHHEPPDDGYNNVARKKWNKIATDIKLVFYSSTITKINGPVNIQNIQDNMNFKLEINFFFTVLPSILILLHLLFAQTNVQPDCSRKLLKLTLQYKLKFSYMFGFNNQHQGV